MEVWLLTHKLMFRGLEEVPKPSIIVHDHGSASRELEATGGDKNVLQGATCLVVGDVDASGVIVHGRHVGVGEKSHALQEHIERSGLQRSRRVSRGRPGLFRCHGTVKSTE